MPATFTWKERNNGEETESTITTINFGSVNAPDLVPVNYPIVRGQNSFSKYIRCLFTGTFTEISAMKFWKDSGTYRTGEKIKAAANVTYATPSQTGTGDPDIPEVIGSALPIEAKDGKIDTVASTPTAGGSGYEVDDILTVSEGIGGQVKVLTIDTGGVVTSIEKYADGIGGYSVGSGKATESETGGGTGCTIEITAITTVSVIVVPGYTKYFRLQTQSTLSTELGAGAQKVLIFQYDEI